MVTIAIILKDDPSVIETVNRICRQKNLGDYEVLVIDRSKIKYPNVDFPKKVRWIPYLNNVKKYTIPEQRNIAIEEARGEIIAFIDASCIPDDLWLHEIIKPILQGNEKIVAGRTGSIGKNTINDLSHSENAKKTYLHEAPTINLAIHREIFSTVGKFDESLEYGSDVDFTWRAIEQGYKIFYAPKAYIEHDWGNNKDEFKRTILYGKARARLLIKHIETHWMNLFTRDSHVLLYPTLILSLLAFPLFPWNLIPYPLLVLKNIRQPNPIGIVIKHVVYGLGVILEIKHQLFTLIKKMSKKLLSVSVTYHLGMVLLFTLLYGLLINTVLLHVGINNPLSPEYTWPAYLFFIPFAVKTTFEAVKLLSKRLKTWPLYLLFLLNPFIAVAGVIYLDNSGNSVLAIASVILICINFIITYFHRDSSANILKPALYSAALSLLLANSMRSNYLVGYDVHQEYLVFRLTSMRDFWDINTFKDAYNACLSITILPTIIHNLTGIAPLTIMKLVYPMIIAFLPVVVFQIGDRLSNPKIAFVGAFAFLLQAQFISQLPALTRQGVAFIFFALMIDVLLLRRSNYYIRQIIFVLFGVGMIWSHYSTTYVGLFILLTAKIVSIVVGRIWKYNERSNSLSLSAIILLLSIAFFWNVMITETTGSLQHTFTKVISNMQNVFVLENKSDTVKGIIYATESNNAAVERYSAGSVKASSNPEYYKAYRVRPMSLNTGRQINIKSPIPFYFHVIIPWIFRISILVGFLYVLRHEYKYRQSTLVLGLALGMFSITFLFALLPSLSLDYNFERLFQQALILLAPICAIGFYALILKIEKLPTPVFIAIILISYLVQTTGFVDFALFGSPKWIFSNTGEQYYRYFTHKEEIEGVHWLAANTPNNILLYSDRYSKIRALAYSDQKFNFISSQINPPVIENYGYVMEGYAATSTGAVFALINNKTLVFTFPTIFIYENKNTVYSNKSTKIYK